MSTSTNPGLAILTSVLEEFKDRLSIDGSSRILLTDATVAKHLVALTRDISTPYGPTFTIATAEPGAATSPGEQEDLGPNVEVKQIADLTGKMDHFTHALTDVSRASGKTCMEIMKWAKYALQPKGILVVVALKRTEAEGDFVERMQGQSKGRVSSLGDVLEWAGFERGKVRSMTRGEGAGEAEVVLAMKWDQLTA
ncbi:hypothetical protein LTR53_016193 [Teratosphaeriaceae sp. CCFEE 6253]|nr:hypothetical protein LTR53_016193 [Teratosphaeriaceae sp. CCFEE 6253]